MQDALSSVGSIPIGDSDIFFVPCSCQAYYFTLHISFHSPSLFTYQLMPVHMEVGDPGKVRYPASVGLPISPYNLSLLLDRVHKWSGVPYRGGFHRQPRRGWDEFPPCQCWRLGGVMFIRAILWILPNSAKALQNNMVVNQYKRCELFRRYHLQNIDNNATEESSEGVEGALVESDNQAGRPILDEAEVVPVRTTKRKASFDEINGESKSARKLSKKNTESQGMDFSTGWTCPQISQGI